MGVADSEHFNIGRAHAFHNIKLLLRVHEIAGLRGIGILHGEHTGNSCACTGKNAAAFIGKA